LRNATIEELASFLSGLPALNRPVLDRTGNTGRFDITLTLDTPNKELEPAIALKSALVNSDFGTFSSSLGLLGLKLESVKIPVDMVVIDRAEKPSEN
jgi:uncharacterized protein (TIGR03435 family)